MTSVAVWRLGHALPSSHRHHVTPRHAARGLSGARTVAAAAGVCGYRTAPGSLKLLSRRVPYSEPWTVVIPSQTSRHNRIDVVDARSQRRRRTGHDQDQVRGVPRSSTDRSIEAASGKEPGSVDRRRHHNVRPSPDPLDDSSHGKRCNHRRQKKGRCIEG